MLKRAAFSSKSGRENPMPLSESMPFSSQKRAFLTSAICSMISKVIFDSLFIKTPFVNIHIGQVRKKLRSQCQGLLCAAAVNAGCAEGAVCHRQRVLNAGDEVQGGSGGVDCHKANIIKTINVPYFHEGEGKKKEGKLL